MELPLRVIDAFTDTRFQGNPAAVLIHDEWLPEPLMQAIAAENNLSETAFVKPLGARHYAIRWFSPFTEIPFCGHATLASSFALFSDDPAAEEIFFHADAVGELAVQRLADGLIQMRFPRRAPEPVAAPPEEVFTGLSIRPARVLRNVQAYFAVYEREEDVRAVVAHGPTLAKLAPYDMVVTAPGTASDFDCVSRYFWPAHGGDEDPVTGSIHAGLAPYWAEHLGKTELVAFQASKRGGVLHCRVAGDFVFVSGRAVQYLSGIITV